VIKATQLVEWRELWAKVISLPSEREHRVTWDRFARESFELVRVALLYQRNALEMYEETTLHELLRPLNLEVVPQLPWPADTDPLFPNIMSCPNTMAGGVFLASASFRLPAAVLKAVELSADPFESPELKLLKRDAEWDRKTVSGFFGGVKTLGCCKERPLNSDEPGRLRNAIVIAVLHRDDFGHGEVGQPVTEGAYKREREEVLNSLHVCRILEAQRELCRWTLARLAEKR